MSAARYITGWATARVTGAEPEKFLAALAERGIGFWGAAPPEDYTLTVELPMRAAKLVPELARSLGCEGSVTALHGLPALVRRLRGRYLFAALLAAAALLWGASLAYVWDIDITGNETVPDGVIRQALAECGVDIGARWTDFSQDLIRNAVILRLPQLRWMTVTMQGCRAHVIVRERREYIEPVDEDAYADIVADKAGLVTEVRALRGTAETQPGRVVLPGETIVGGYSTGRFGVQGPVRAAGWAEARTWYELTMQAPLTVDLKRHTGQTRTYYSLVFGKNRINFYKGSSICPEDCDKIIEEYPLAVAGVFTLPVTLERLTVSVYGTEAVEAAELRGELERALMEELLARIGDGEVTASAFTASASEGVLCVTLHAECLEKIGTSVPLTDEEIFMLKNTKDAVEDGT